MSAWGDRPVCADPGCGYRASRPSGLCGHCDNRRQREQARDRARRERDEFRARRLADTSGAARQLWRVGVECAPGLAGVLLTADEARRVAVHMAARPLRRPRAEEASRGR